MSVKYGETLGIGFGVPLLTVRVFVWGLFVHAEPFAGLDVAVEHEVV